MHPRHFTSIGAHAASRLTGLDVSPDHWCHVALVVHEAGVEVRSLVWVWRVDKRLTTGEGIFLQGSASRMRCIKVSWAYQEMEHGEEVARWHEHVVAEPSTGIISLLLLKVAFDLKIELTQQ